MEDLTTIRKERVTPVGNQKPVQAKTTTRPVRVGDMLTGFDRISEYPQRSEILKAVFAGFNLDPYR